MSPVQKRNTRRAAAQAADRQRLDDDLQAEIATLRELIRQMAAAFEAQANTSEQLRILAVLGQSSAHLAQVLKVHSELGGDSALIEAIRHTAEQVRQALEKTPRPPEDRATPGAA